METQSTHVYQSVLNVCVCGGGDCDVKVVCWWQSIFSTSSKFSPGVLTQPLTLAGSQKKVVKKAGWGVRQVSGDGE